MTAAAKTVLPLAAVPVPSNDDFPGAVRAPNVVQRLSMGRTRVVRVDVRRPRRVSEIDCAEKAFFPQLLWSIYCSYDQDDAGNRAVVDAMRRDLLIWADLMMPGQWSDFTRETNNAVKSALEPMFDAHAMGWQSIKVLTVFMLLVKWVDQHAAQAMFTTDFARTLGEVAAYLDQMHGDECDAVEPSAHKMLCKVIARIKACGLFHWLPDYRGAEA